MKKFFTFIAFAAATLAAQATTIVNEYKVWTFDGMTAKESVTELTDVDGLVIRCTEAHTAQYIAKKRSGSFSDGLEYKNKAVGLKLSANTGLKPATDMVSDSECKNANDRSIAVTTGIAGTFYVAFVSEYSKDDRAIKLFFNGEEVKSVDAKTIYDTEEPSRTSVFEYKASEGGTFLFGGSSATVCYVMFVPEGYTPTGISQIKNNALKNGKVFNIAGQAANKASKGIVIKDGKKFICK